MATIGMDRLYYAKITEASDGEETYGVPAPLAKAMNGADISWIVSLVVTSLVYYPLAKKTMKVPDTMIYPPAQAAAAPAATGVNFSTSSLRAGQAG